MKKLLFLAGSARKDSLNKKLAHHAYGLAVEKGADCIFVDLKNFEMPLYCEDYESEHGMPDNAKKLKKLFHDCDGFLIASPEYNSTFTPLLKNTIDWMSRGGDEQARQWTPYKGKVAAICSTSPGPLGGLRGLTPLRTLLSNIGVHVIPTQVAVGGGVDNNGAPTQDMHVTLTNAMVEQLITTAKALNA